MTTEVSAEGAGDVSPNASDPQDGRGPYECLSKYPPKITRQIICEAIYLFVIFFLSGFLIFSTWKGWMSALLSSQQSQNATIKEFLYYVSAGMLGGNVFGMKYFYRVVARGFWHQDRRYWRIMSPFIATSVAFIVGAMIDANFVPVHKPVSGASFVSIGFLAGYFADEAVGKMYEIASVIFGKSGSATNEIKQVENGKPETKQIT